MTDEDFQKKDTRKRITEVRQNSGSTICLSKESDDKPEDDRLAPAMIRSLEGLIGSAQQKIDHLRNKPKVRFQSPESGESASEPAGILPGSQDNNLLEQSFLDASDAEIGPEALKELEDRLRPYEWEA